jgi:REP element-mobilizing transposase RayT
MTINEDHCEDLYRIITSLIKSRNCFLKRINGVGNHIHILVDLHPSISVADLVQQVKHDSSVWIKQSSLFPLWKGWAGGYFAGSVSPSLETAVVDYIKRQKEHHGVRTFEDEFQALLRSAGIEFNGYMPQ